MKYQINDLIHILDNQAYFYWYEPEAEMECATLYFSLKEPENIDNISERFFGFAVRFNWVICGENVLNEPEEKNKIIQKSESKREKPCSAGTPQGENTNVPIKYKGCNNYNHYAAFLQ